jgi:hypothetical protein
MLFTASSVLYCPTFFRCQSTLSLDANRINPHDLRFLKTSREIATSLRSSQRQYEELGMQNTNAASGIQSADA